MRAGESRVEIKIKNTKEFGNFYFLLKTMCEKEVARLELALNSEDPAEKKDAQAELFRELKIFINTKADMVALVSIKLYIDIFKPWKNIESSPFIDISKEKIGLELHRTDTPQAYREAMIELSRKHQEHFAFIYTQAMLSSDIKESPTKSIFDTTDRKLEFITDFISRSLDCSKPILISEKVATFLFRTKYVYAPVMLLILDLHRKITANKEERKAFRLALTHWKATLKWDNDHLLKHTIHQNEFVQATNKILAKASGFRPSHEVSDISVITQKLDQLCGYKYRPSTRNNFLEQVEKEWKKLRKEMQPLNSKAKPKRNGTGFAIGEASCAFLNNMKGTQAVAVQTVIEHLSKNIKVALKDHQIPSTQMNSHTIKKKLTVKVSNTTNKKIDSLEKKTGLSGSKLLEFAVKYYAQSHDAFAPDIKLNMQNLKSPIAELPVTSEAAVYTQSQAEQLQSTKNESDLQPASETTVAVATENIEPSNPLQKSAPTEATAIKVAQQAIEPLTADEQRTRVHEQQVAAPPPQSTTSSNEVTDDGLPKG